MYLIDADGDQVDVVLSNCPRFQKWLAMHRHRPSTSDYSFVDSTENLTRLGILPGTVGAVGTVGTVETTPLNFDKWCSELSDAIRLDPLPTRWSPELRQHQKAIDKFADWVVEHEKSINEEERTVIREEAIEVCVPISLQYVSQFYDGMCPNISF